MSVSPALPDDPVADVTSAGSAEVGDVFVITSGDIVDYSNDPLAEVLDTNLVRLFREYEAWVGPGDFEPSNLSWAIEGGAVKVVIYGTKGTLDGVEEAVKERLGLDIDRFVTYKSAGKATVPFDLLDDLAGIDDIRSVAAISPMVTGPVNPSDIMPVDAVVLAPVAVADPLDGAYSAELEEFATSPLSTKMGSDLFMLQKEYEAYKSDSKAGTFNANRPGLAMVGEEVVVTVTFDALISAKGDISAIINQRALELGELGFHVQHKAGPSVIGSVAPDLLDDIALCDGVLSLVPSYTITSAGLVTSQGDQAQGSDAARSTFGVDGSGVQMGVISDSMASLTSGVTYSSDVGSGDLPSVTILSDQPGTDEGRAMAQIIHDVAPGADILFHDCGSSVFDISEAILALARAGADVIVDDVLSTASPFFMRGPVSRTIGYVTSEEVGATYVTAAGNWGDDAYRSGFVSSGTTIQSGLAHDFDPGAGVDFTQQITLPAGGRLLLGLQWDQPYITMMSGFDGFVGPIIPNSHDYDIYLYNSSGVVVASSALNNIGGDPCELISYQNGTGSTQTYNLVLTRNSARSATGNVVLQYIDYRQNASFQYVTNSPTIVGHRNEEDAITVGAAPYYSTPPSVASYSSLGGNPILLGADGSHMATPLTPQKPDVVGPDGVNNTFFGSPVDLESDGYWNFLGTSAAAPHVAGLAALLLERAPGLGASDIESILEDTADDMHTAGFDFLTGDGHVDAVAALGGIGTRFPHLEATQDGSADTFVVSRSGSYIQVAINGGTPTSYLVSSVDAISLGGSSDVDTFTVNNLGNFAGRIVINSNDTAAALDTVSVYDTSGNDHFEGSPERSAFVTPTYSVAVRNAYAVLPYSTAGGNDTSNLYGYADSGSDRFKGEHELTYSTAKLYRTGEYYYRPKGFEIVEAYGLSGPDVAYFYDKTGSTDAFFGSKEYSSHSGTAFDMRLHDFPTVTAYGSASEGDVANFRNSDIKDEFIGRVNKSELVDRTTGGTVYSITARTFAESHVEVGAGMSTYQDIAKLYDTTASEHLIAFLSGGVPNISMYTNTGALDLLYEVIGWETVSARGYSSTTNTTSITGVIPSLILDGWWDGIEY